jgi:hypothetical protein
MKIRQAIIGVLICFMLGLNFAEAHNSNDVGHKHSKNWHQVWHRIWHNKWQMKRHLMRWHNRSNAANKVNSPSTVIASLVSDAHHGFNEPKSSHSSGNGGSSLFGGDGGMNGYTKAPEISVASGASAIALLTGILLLMGEKTRTLRA